MQYHNAQFNCDPVALKHSNRVFRIHIMTGIKKCCVNSPSVYTLFSVIGITGDTCTCNMPLLKLFHCASLSQDDSRRPHVVCQREQKLWGVKYRTIMLDATYYVSTLTFTAELLHVNHCNAKHVDWHDNCIICGYFPPSHLFCLHRVF